MNGVLLMTMGDPASQSEVLPFLLKLFSDPLIIRAPWFVRYPLSLYISLKKLASVKEKYGLIGGGSPMNDMTERQAKALEERLGGGVRVYVANRYCKPSTADAYRRIKADGIRKLVALPLYPHYSPAITGSSFRALESLLKRDPRPPDVEWIKSIATDPRFVEAYAAKVKDALAEFDGEGHGEIPVLFSAHALPKKFIDEGDPYVSEIEAAVARLREHIGPVNGTVCFQSKGRPSMEWLRPETDDVLRELANEGHDKVVIAPISFVSENIETLYDVDILYRGMARSLGIKKFARARCLNDEPAFINALAKIIQETLKA